MQLPKRLIVAGLAAAAALAARRSLTPAYDLRGKSVLVTGGSRGLGLALAEECARRGARLTLMARTQSELERAEQRLREQGAEVQIVCGDVAQEADLARAVAQSVAAWGRLDAVINNAGIIQTGPVQDMTEEDWRTIMEVNAFAPLRLMALALPQLRRHQGRFLLVASIGGKVAVPHLGPYSMSKYAAVGLGAALRSELARDGVSVTTVCPGLMQTGSPRNALVKGDHEREYAFFATLDNLPLVSMDAQAAARRMVDAMVRGEAEVMVGLPAVALRYAAALAPELVADLMRLSNNFLPAPTGDTRAVRGFEAESDLTRNNPLKRAAEQRWGQNH
ncbi:SDR family NAD(P)-dependent oxidoreductase [Deinococcus lacus]|uniref:SDR family NAD(P)-dependent oxidoreductase n=1 Tax=Deinococcus lacus TaxID=392561 RepID=A0ABW1YBF1_9DEIO